MTPSEGAWLRNSWRMRKALCDADRPASVSVAVPANSVLIAA